MPEMADAGRTAAARGALAQADPSMENFTGMNALRNFAVACLFLCAPQLAGAPQNAPRNLWIATWAASPEPTSPDPNEPLLNIEDQTARERVRVSIGCARICIRFSNEYGSAPLLIGAVTVAVPNDPARIKPGTIQTVTFGGHNSVTVPAGAPVLSDPVAFPVTAGAEISISLYFPKRVATPTLHGLALKRAVVSKHGDQTRAEKIEGGSASESSILVSAVLVPAQPSQRLIVAFGDSITDGDGSAVDADRTWTSDLLRRLEKTPEGSQLAVVNEGIAGNRLLTDGFLVSFGVSALARFDRDALALPGVTHIVLLEGINDIGFPGAKLGDSYLADPADVHTPEELIGAYRQLISRAHAQGVKLIGATITPFEGVDFPGYYSESKEAVRQAVNKWIRTGGSFDSVIDFDKVLRDPNHPSKLLPRFASPDHLHPNDLGYQAMADAIDLALFK
jgi:lysophospholipase L1-like esterase